MAGDTTPKHTDWNIRTTNQRDTKLPDYNYQGNVNIVAPDEDTHIQQANNTTDLLDIAFIRSK